MIDHTSVAPLPPSPRWSTLVWSYGFLSASPLFNPSPVVKTLASLSRDPSGSRLHDVPGRQPLRQLRHGQTSVDSTHPRARDNSLRPIWASPFGPPMSREKARGGQ